MRLNRKGLKTFVEVGLDLLAIRDKKLYREGFKTFEGYLKTRWQLSKSYATRLIQASAVMPNLVPIGNVLPEKENQARPLTSLANHSMKLFHSFLPHMNKFDSRVIQLIIFVTCVYSNYFQRCGSKSSKIPLILMKGQIRLEKI
jgi:hypothetical protein